MAKEKEKKLMSSRIKKYITLAELEVSEKGPVYVSNATTGEAEEGQILISVPKKHGNSSDLVRVPRTFIPINLADQAPRSQLLEASEFRKAVGNGHIKLLNPEYAKALLESDEGREEARRITNDMNKARTLMANAGVVASEKEDDDDEYVDVDNIGKDVKKSKQKSANAGRPTVSVKLQTLVNTSEEAGENEKALIGRLRNYRGGKLDRPELEFLANRFKTKPRIKEYLRDVLRATKKAEEAEA